MEKNNMKIYDRVRSVPAHAMKPIVGGRLKGKSDINPMWRLKMLTEVFGPCGIGWWYDVVGERLEADPTTKQIAAFVDIKFYYIDPDSGAVSHGIPGTGGSTFVAKERDGLSMSDECFKMALTDAISVAVKAIGVAADVYFEKDKTKYDTRPTAPKPPVQHDAKPKEDFDYYCERCGHKIGIYKDGNGKNIPIKKWAEGTKETFGEVLCKSCYEGIKAYDGIKANES